MDGTSGPLGRGLPKDGRRLVWEWTLAVLSVEGWFDEPQERSSLHGGAGNGVNVEASGSIAARVFERDPRRIVQQVVAGGSLTRRLTRSYVCT